jgi:hypothetical protein
VEERREGGRGAEWSELVRMRVRVRVRWMDGWVGGWVDGWVLILQWTSPSVQP